MTRVTLLAPGFDPRHTPQAADVSRLTPAGVDPRAAHL